MHWIIGGIQVEDDRLGRLAVRVEQQIDGQPVDRPWIMRDPAVAVDHGRAMLQPVQRAPSGQRPATTVPCRQSTERHAQDRIVPPSIVIDQVVVAERKPEQPLAEQGRKVTHDPVAGAAVGRPCSEPLDQPDRPIHGPYPQRASVLEHFHTDRT